MSIDKDYNRETIIFTKQKYKIIFKYYKLNEWKITAKDTESDIKYVARLNGFPFIEFAFYDNIMNLLENCNSILECLDDRILLTVDVSAFLGNIWKFTLDKKDIKNNALNYYQFLISSYNTNISVVENDTESYLIDVNPEDFRDIDVCKSDNRIQMIDCIIDILIHYMKKELVLCSVYIRYIVDTNGLITNCHIKLFMRDGKKVKLLTSGSVNKTAYIIPFITTKIKNPNDLNGSDWQNIKESAFIHFKP
jgi:hypothetical protein